MNPDAALVETVARLQGVLKVQRRLGMSPFYEDIEALLTAFAASGQPAQHVCQSSDSNEPCVLCGRRL